MLDSFGRDTKSSIGETMMIFVDAGFARVHKNHHKSAPRNQTFKLGSSGTA